MEPVTDICLLVPKEPFDCKRLLKIFQAYRFVDKGSSYKVKGTFKELDKLYNSLCQCGAPCGDGTSQRRGHASAEVQSVTVSARVMEYIMQKCEDKVQSIEGDSVVMETLRDHTGQHAAGNVVQVTFRPRLESPRPPESFRCGCARQRFITFYQRTACDLQETSIQLSSSDQAFLQQHFPLLLFKCSSNKKEATVMGPFTHVAELKETLSQNTETWKKRPGRRGPQACQSPNTAESPTRSKDPEEETCPICMDRIESGERTTLRCDHSFCKGCLNRAFQYKPVCPTCGRMYGVLKGTQPEGGTMTATHMSASLPGYNKSGTIVIQYHIPEGIQKEEHPSPGQPYAGVSRQAFLPDCAEGRAVLSLLKRAFSQRLVFTIGRSSTSGRNNVVTWNDIHHKTSRDGGPTNYGFPDPNYLDRVREELKVKGIE